MFEAAASALGLAAASAVGTAAGEEAYNYGKNIVNNMRRKADDEADSDLEDNHKRLKEEAKKLYARRDDILAQTKTKLVNQVCEAWISRVMKSEEEVRELEIKYICGKRNKKIRSQHGSSKSRTDLSKIMAEKCDELHNLWLEEKSKIGILVEKSPERVIIMHGPKPEDKPFLHSIVEKILGHLRDKNVKRFGLWGMPGIGKTTIMKSLNNYEDIAKMFDIVIWVTVSKDLSLEELQHKIGDRLKLNMEGITEPEIAQQIWRELKSKRYLLLLDEVWDTLDLSLIGMYESEMDSKVVLATRYLHVCSDMDTHWELKVPRLSEADAWNMFKVKVGRHFNIPSVEPIAKEVVIECAGLPLLIDKVASNFRRRDTIHLWRDGLRSLRRWPSINSQGIGELIECLEFCYEDLKDEVQKDCFLYCALYTEDYEINTDPLLECWTVEGFIHDASEFRVARGMGHSILKELISVSLLEKSEKMNHVRMNKVIRTMALNISSRRCNFNILVKPHGGLQEVPDEVEWQQANRISLMDSKLVTLPKMPDCNKLSTLLLQRNWELKEIPDLFFRYMQNLRVLDLHGTGIMLLPSTISVLKCLRALYLHSCISLMQLHLNGLEHLEVLDIRDTGLKHFPIQIRHLFRLKCLRMSLSNFGIIHSGDVESCRNVFSSLYLLEELQIIGNSNNQSWELTAKVISEGVATLMHLTSLSICFPTVDCLKSFISMSQSWKDCCFTFQFSVGYQDTTLYKILGCFGYQNMNCLKFANGEGVDPIISDVLLKTHAFELIGHKGASRLSDFGIESINKMRGCLIEGCNEIETIVDGNRVMRSALICLEKMFINNVPNLKSIWEGPVPNGSLSQLTTLTLCNCLKLKKIFSMGMIEQLSQLQHLKVEYCPEIEEIIAESENNGLEPDALPRLKTLELSDLPRVKSIWTSDSLKWPSLEMIKISMCQMLTKLPFNSENAINLRCIEAHQTWWSALACQDDAIKQRLKSLCGAASGIGSAAASAVGTAAGDEAYKYAKEIINNLSCKVDNKADNDIEYNYERLIEQAKKLYACRDDILAQAKTKLVTQVYEAWISRVMKSEEEVRDLETKFKKEKGKKRTRSQRLIGSSESRTDLSQSMAEKCKKLHNLWVEGKSKIGIVVEKLPERVIIMHGPKSEDKIFLDSTVEQILGHLRDKTVKRIGLWGMSGIGKTTIMQGLNNNEDTAKMFDIVIWVTVSKDWNLEKLQHKIADRLKLNMEGIADPNEIAQLICRDLKSKRCLLLLDEVWEVLDLPLIGMFESEKDSKVVVATRYYHVCCDMETDLNINVKRMSEADAWKMFKVKVGRNVNLPGIEPMAKLAVSECAGLPLSIDKVASMFELPPFYSMPRSPDPFLLGLSFLTKLNLRNCNLMAIPKDIGSLFSLKEVDLSGNNFVCLPESINGLCKLRMMDLENCTNLRSLPKLPLSIATISAAGCTSLKPNYLCEVEPFLSNFSKLADNQGVISMISTAIRKHLQGLYVDSRYDIIFHGSVIPKWFRHQSVGAEVIMKFPFHLCDKVIGIAVCSAFCSLPHHQICDKCSLNCQLIVNGKEVALALGIETIVGSSNQIWALYLAFKFYQEGDLISLRECDENGLSQIGIRIETASGLEVKKCGLRMVFKKDTEDWKESSKTDLGELVRGEDLIGQFGRLFAKEKSEEQITLEPQTVLLDVEEVDMTIHSSEETKFEIEEIGCEASQTQPEGIEMMFDGEAMQTQATSTLKPQGAVFDVEAYKITESSRQMEFQIEDIEMEPEAIEQHGSKVDQREEARRLLMQGGLGLTEPPKDDDWENAKQIYLMNNEFSILPENPKCPELSALFLQRNYKLRTIPHSFFDDMPTLQILNLSRTSIRSLPDSLTRLVSLKRLFLNDCHCFMMLSPKVGELKQLEVLDLEGTEIMHLPEEIKKLTCLTCLEVSFYGYTSDGRRAMQSNSVVPYGVISALSQLEELNIDANPDDKGWDACVEAILTEICNLKRLNTLKFYFPRVKLLRHLQCNSPMGIYPSLPHFRFTVGHHVKRIMPRVPRDVEFELERWEKCLKYINGVDIPIDIKKALQHATAFFLDRHATVKNLSNFGIQNMEKLKCCVMGECNEVQLIIDEAHAYEEDDDSDEIAYDSYGAEKIVLGSLEYLYVYRMKSLRSIWNGQFQGKSLFLLKSLTFHTCPQLTTIFIPRFLDELCNLEELTVKDCPSIRSLVSSENTAEHKSSCFLPNLKRISLHYMPGLVRISGGLHIAPNLEWSSFYNCPDLENPFTEEVSSKDLKKIKGERSWWEALQWSDGGPGYLDKIFEPIDMGLLST